MGPPINELSAAARALSRGRFAGCLSRRDRGASVAGIAHSLRKLAFASKEGQFGADRCTSHRSNVLR
jgi:hypothetical protein